MRRFNGKRQSERDEVSKGTGREGGTGEGANRRGRKDRCGLVQILAAWRDACPIIKTHIERAGQGNEIDHCEDPLVSATAKAFELLEIAYYGKLGLTSEGSYKAGLDDFVEGKKSGEEFLKPSHRFPSGSQNTTNRGSLCPCRLM